MKSKSKKQRLDQVLLEKGVVSCLKEAQALILSGVVWTKNSRLEKTGQLISPDLPIEIRVKLTPFVSRAGKKLQYALDTFSVSVENKICLDIGCSSGGFTDCLLQNKASHVFAIDVGYGQFDYSLRAHPQITLLEKTNARYLTRTTLLSCHATAKKIDFLCMDVSFISIMTILNPLFLEFPEIEDCILLFKPQFEVKKQWIEKKGVVKNEVVIKDTLHKFHSFMLSRNYVLQKEPQKSPLPGKKSGNIEILLYYSKQI